MVKPIRLVLIMFTIDTGIFISNYWHVATTHSVSELGWIYYSLFKSRILFPILKQTTAWNNYILYYFIFQNIRNNSQNTLPIVCHYPRFQKFSKCSNVFNVLDFSLKSHTKISVVSFEHHLCVEWLLLYLCQCKQPPRSHTGTWGCRTGWRCLSGSGSSGPPGSAPAPWALRRQTCRRRPPAPPPGTHPSGLRSLSVHTYRTWSWCKSEIPKQKLLLHPAGTSHNSYKCGTIKSFWHIFTMRKLYFEVFEIN